LISAGCGNASTVIRRLPWPAFLAAVALLAAACGGNGDAAPADDVPDAPGQVEGDYEQTLRAVNQTVRSASETIGEAGAPETGEIFVALEAQLSDAWLRLGQLSPPSELLPQHDRLSQSLGEASDIAASLGGREEPPTEEEVDMLRQSLRDADEALAEFEEEGYDVGPRT
jgi:hypothetical protein